MIDLLNNLICDDLENTLYELYLESSDMDFSLNVFVTEMQSMKSQVIKDLKYLDKIDVTVYEALHSLNSLRSALDLESTSVEGNSYTENYSSSTSTVDTCISSNTILSNKEELSISINTNISNKEELSISTNIKNELLLQEQINNLNQMVLCLENEKLELTDKINDNEQKFEHLQNDFDEKSKDCSNLRNKECETINYIISLIDIFYEPNIIHTKSVPEILELLSQVIISKDIKLPKITHTDSSLGDEETVNAETVIKSFSEEVARDASINMSEELALLHCNDYEKIDFVVENSVDILMKSVLKIINCCCGKKNEDEVKKIFSDFGNTFSAKVKELPAAVTDLNNTDVFENIEKELQVEIEISDLQKKLSSLASENALLLSTNEETIRAKEDSDCLVESLQRELTNCSAELSIAIDNSKRLEAVNESHESSLKELHEIIDSLKSELEEMQLDYESSQLNLEMLNEEHVELNNNLKNHMELLHSVEVERNDLLSRFQKIDGTVNDLRTENEHLKAAGDIHSLEDEIGKLKSDVIEVTEEKNFLFTKLSSAKSELEDASSRLFEFESSFMDQKNLLLSLEEERNILQSTLDDRNIELDLALEDCIKANEEIENKNLSLKEKEEQYRDVCKELESTQKKLEDADVEKKCIEKEMRELVDEFDRKSQVAKVIVNDLESRVRILELENEGLQGAKDAICELKIKYAELEIELLSVQEEKADLNDRLTKLDSELEEMSESLKSLQEKFVNKEEESQINESKIKELRLEIDEFQSIHQRESDHSAQLLSELTMKLRAKENDNEDLLVKVEELKMKIAADIEKMNQLESNLCVKAEENLRIVKELQNKTEEFNTMNEEFTALQEKVNKVIDQDRLLKIAEENITKVTGELTSSNKELRTCKIEIDNLKRSLQEMETNEIDLKKDQEKLVNFESKLKDKEFEIRSLSNMIREKERDNEDLIRKAKESFQSCMWKEVQLKEMKYKLEDLKNSIDSKVDIKVNEQMKLLEREKLRLLENKDEQFNKQKDELEDVVKSYNTLKARYLDKRQRTNELQANFDELKVKFNELQVKYESKK